MNIFREKEVIERTNTCFLCLIRKGKITLTVAWYVFLLFVMCGNWARFAAIAMKALKESLRVPDRMGWNGDPCAPTSWDAWEGVTCHPNKDALVVSQM